MSDDPVEPPRYDPPPPSFAGGPAPGTAPPGGAPFSATPPPAGGPPPVPGAGGEPLNAWLAIWIRPRAVMRQILDTDPRRLVHVLAIAAGLIEVMQAHIPSRPPFVIPPGVLLWAKALLGILGGLLGLYVGSALVWMTGRWLGGRGTFTGVRAATAWSRVPVIWGGMLWLPMIAYAGAEAVNFDPQSLLGEPAGMLLYVMLTLARLVVVVWAFVVYCKCVGEAHGFSAWHSFGATLIAVILFAIPLAILAVLVIGMIGLAALGLH